MVLSQKRIRELSPGLIRCPSHAVSGVMPEFRELPRILEDGEVPNDWVVDVKVHMLMPGMYPCIPDWHCDFIPRDEDGRLRYDLADPENEFKLWLSGSPLTEYIGDIFGRPVAIDPHSIVDHSSLEPLLRDERRCPVRPGEWAVLSQLTPHRGTPARHNTWRVFIRASPPSMVTPLPFGKWLRRHSQVYVEKGFSW